MADVASHAIITVSESFEHAARDQESSETDEKALIAAINGVSRVIRNHLRRIVCPTTDIDEIFDGDGTDSQYVRHMRINATPTLYYWTGSAWSEMSQASYYWNYDGDKGLIYFERGAVFGEVARGYKVSYNTGWGRADVPDDLKYAAFMLLEWNRQRIEKMGVASESFGGHTVGFDLRGRDRRGQAKGIPPEIADMISNYRSPYLG